MSDIYAKTKSHFGDLAVDKRIASRHELARLTIHFGGVGRCSCEHYWAFRKRTKKEFQYIFTGFNG